MDAKEKCVRKLPILKQHERRQKKCIIYFLRHKFTREDRLIIIDWMHASTVFFRFDDPVFFYAVSYFDLILSWKRTQQMGIEQLQCLAACCLWTAVSEVFGSDALSINDILDWNEDDPFCTKKSVRFMYHFINERFKFWTFIVTPYDFLMCFLTILKTRKTHNLTWMSLYLLELSQYSDRMCLNNFWPSLIAAGALFASLRILKLIDIWIPDLTLLTGYAADDTDVTLVVDILSRFFMQASTTDRYKSVYRKYSLVGRKCVAQIKI